MAKLTTSLAARRRKRQPNPKLIKSHFSYTVAELAAVYAIHRNTVRQWIKQGLKTNDENRPFLIQGVVIRQFLEARRAAKKRPCKPWEFFCFKCRLPKSAGGLVAEYQSITNTHGNLHALCPDCTTSMNRRVARSEIDEISTKIDVTFLQAESHISESPHPRLNSEFKTGD